MIIAVDGPLAAGKGTIAKALARHYGLPHMDTGKLYRSVAYRLLALGKSPDDIVSATQIAHGLSLDGIEDHNLRTAQVGAAASVVAVHPSVRQALYDLQRGFALQPGGAVLDGRDIGTVVCPEADVKLFVSASSEERAGRRLQELLAQGEAISYADMLAQTLERDARDSGRVDAPLRPAEDAHLLDTTGLSIEAAVDKARLIVDHIRLAKS
ncbi:(d)CMP kinase [Candidatus Phycosocius spiralis]|uniref:Cytidylate kinase n=1 Tax=Candidatus Phycosocius spiralis TaxID=2815099 RepID=A0ABQ4PUF2_9PROT|nr:(d)CMP kinase [Candidatus Phycosocius spiralis]GIU66625.1 cytidylate kinase [Candidatus Phycosocius spiralis]